MFKFFFEWIIPVVITLVSVYFCFYSLKQSNKVSSGTQEYKEWMKLYIVSGISFSFFATLLMFSMAIELVG